MSINSHTVAQHLNARPEHLDPAWRYTPLNEDRQPVSSIRNDPRFWEGVEADWDGFTSWAADGNAIGILPERSGLVIIDCDHHKNWDIVDGTARLVAEHGINDLTRIAHEQNETIPATFTVSTKSGGYHLYYRQNPLLAVTSKGHREGWLIDIKASKNTYAVAPPTEGYQVVRDFPVAELPLWLASWIATLNRNTKPVGDSAVTQKFADAKAWKIDIQELGSGSSLFDAWCTAMLGAVITAAEHGGWNNAVYRVAREFFDVGISEADALAMIMTATPPWDAKGSETLARTVASAWRGHREK